MKNMVLTLIFSYLCCCALLYFGQRALLYFPSPNDVVAAKSISFTNEGVELKGWIVNPGQAQALLYYGGNAEKIEQNIALFESKFTAYSVYLIPYRGFGASSGTPTETGLYSDGLYIYDQLRNSHSKISLIGRSLGAAVASYVASSRDIDKLVLVTPFDSVENVARGIYWMFPVSILLKDKYNIVARIAAIEAQTLVLLAETDRVIARRHSEALLAAFEPTAVESVIIKGTDHNNISSVEGYAANISRFLKLKAPKKGQ